MTMLITSTRLASHIKRARKANLYALLRQSGYPRRRFFILPAISCRMGPPNFPHVDRSAISGTPSAIDGTSWPCALCRCLRSALPPSELAARNLFVPVLAPRGGLPCSSRTSGSPREIGPSPRPPLDRRPNSGAHDGKHFGHWTCPPLSSICPVFPANTDSIITPSPSTSLAEFAISFSILLNLGTSRYDEKTAYTLEHYDRMGIWAELKKLRL